MYFRIYIYIYGMYTYGCYPTFFLPGLAPSAPLSRSFRARGKTQQTKTPQHNSGTEASLKTVERLLYQAIHRTNMFPKGPHIRLEMYRGPTGCSQPKKVKQGPPIRPCSSSGLWWGFAGREYRFRRILSAGHDYRSLTSREDKIRRVP